MNNVIMRKVTVGAAYAPLVSERLVASVTISCPPANAGNVVFKVGRAVGAGRVA